MSPVQRDSGHSVQEPSRWRPLSLIPRALAAFRTNIKFVLETSQAYVPTIFSRDPDPETAYDSRITHMPIAATGGSVANFDRHQAIFQGDIGCEDFAAFANASACSKVAPKTAPIQQFVCTGNCKHEDQASICAQGLRDHMLKLEKAVTSSSRTVLFSGVQECGGCSRSPAWDGIELPSQWFAGPTTDRVPTTNLSELLSIPATGSFSLVDTWEKVPVTKLRGTKSHTDSSVAWRLAKVEVQCSDSEAWAEQSATDSLGTFRYSGPLPILGCPQDDLAYQLFAIGALRNARVLSAVMCSVELYQAAAKLLEMRDITMSTGRDVRVGKLRTSNACAQFAKLPTNGPLPPKLSGYATNPTAGYEKMCRRERATGAMRNTSVLAMSLGYDRGVYGGSVAGVWALMDSAFMFDYSAARSNQDLGSKIMDAFVAVRELDTGNTELNSHLLDIATVMACNFTALRGKAELEDGRHLQSKPCVAIWDDLAAMSRYRIADAVFCHVWYDSPGDEASLVMAGLGCAVHDLIDVGPDVACGEISNIIPSLTQGDLSIEALRSVFIGMVAAMEWYATHDPFNTAALAILMTHWWQLDNLRHRTVALMTRVETSPDFAVSPEKLTSAPSFDTFTHKNGLKRDEGQAVLDSLREELAQIEALAFADVQGVIKKLVRPLLDYMDAKSTRLPIEIAYCTEVLEACLSRRHSEKVKILWRLALIMWKSGAIWATVLASTQYAHQGFTNCDRGRPDLDESTWAQN
ncbi:glycosyl Hydrolase Family 88 [Purpureocillium lavendulum]|uniref:Glycosyl Hydrolase Family 88 n=1 Tax=Purpureocillium lavendulum TaxID=1247861 RepID=A0AB34FLI6_9HYPO|nr:glycosyl Hydrolase Family 88 [Purpureocillium lavendulum]